MNKTCQTCKFWKRLEADTCFEHDSRYGNCSCEKFVYSQDMDAARRKTQLPIDGLHYIDCENYGAYFETGQDFGCIHHQENSFLGMVVKQAPFELPKGVLGIVMTTPSDPKDFDPKKHCVVIKEKQEQKSP